MGIKVTAAGLADWQAKGLIPADGTAPCVELPLPPSVNNLFRTFIAKRTVRRAKSSQYLAWIARAVPAARLLRRPAALPCRVVVTVVGKVRANRDLDNLLKPIGDCLVAAGVLPTDDVRSVAGWTVTHTPGDGRPPVVLVRTIGMEWS